MSQLQVSKWHSRVFLCWFEGFLEVWGWVKILSKFEKFHDRSSWRNFRFWPIFHHSHFWLVRQLQVSKWHSRVFLSWFEGFWKFEVELNFCQKLKIFMTAVLSEISDFDHLFKNFISDLWVNCKFKNGILECSYVDLKDFWKFEVVSKFCQNLKVFMTAVLREISDFDQFFITRISDWWVNCKSQNGILECSNVDLKDFWRFEVESKFCQNWKFHDRCP